MNASSRGRPYTSSKPSAVRFAFHPPAGTTPTVSGGFVT